ncbi:MBL fold metallo-hydrolase [Terasakiella sp. A23]|uniref:MBL fold metallo-hydrolase n=1 Tax=Terasakiella sp. FCG-A23 TaxID=3080561 RepID=UPI0029553CBC|nr:MBL fold metallo-hydrolase [Terasakiella sp. A23]MDV7340140.1 MBL fold metallo-hydrolase [Terasakiella sp. A23]
MTKEITYLFDHLPDAGKAIEVAPGVFWVRMPLPFKLNHINLWILDDGDGWIIVDTGINLPEVRERWEMLFADQFAHKPIKRMIVTHFHPDHVGLAGWFEEKFGLQLWMTLGEWGMARNLKLETTERSSEYLTGFYHSAGFDDELMELIPERSVSYPSRIAVPPAGIRRIVDGEKIDVGGHDWQVIVGTGHSPEHACLYCEDLNVMISGDQILPRISPNISIWPQEPTADPLSQFLGSLDLYRHLPEDILILPSHDTPFRGLHARLNDLAHHHDDRLEETYDLCKEPVSAYEVLKGLFTRKLDSHQVFFAIGEALAHLHHLEAKGRLKRTQQDDGVYLFSQL